MVCSGFAVVLFPVFVVLFPVFVAPVVVEVFVGSVDRLLHPPHQPPPHQPPHPPPLAALVVTVKVVDWVPR